MIQEKYRSCHDVMVSDIMRVALLCLLLQGRHEYPVLDWCPELYDLELDFR